LIDLFIAVINSFVY